MGVTDGVQRSRTRRAFLALACAAVVIATSTQTVAAHHDVYRRVSAGARLGNSAISADFSAVSTDGKRVFFRSTERLVVTDTDSSMDIFERSAGTTKRVSTGAINGNGAFPATLAGISADGSRAFFLTVEKLVAGDTDGFEDIYERSAGVTTLVSAGAINGNGAFQVVFRGMSSDGTRIFFATLEKLVATDTDSVVDAYERSGGTTKIVSAGAINGNLASAANFVGASADGGRVWFGTDEKLVGTDTDSHQDIYQRSGGQTFLISRGAINGNGNHLAFFAGASADGSRVFYTSTEQLTASDTDSATDIYEFSPGGIITLISAGAINGNGPDPVAFMGASADGTRVFFVTGEKLVTNDIDAALDVYQRAGGVTTRVSFSGFNGNGAFPASFSAVSADGSRVFFQTDEKLAGSDTDAFLDLYEFSAGTTKHVSVGRINGNGAFVAAFVGLSADGTRLFFSTAEQLAGDDDDTTLDVYERAGGQTDLVSIGAGNFDANFRRCSSDGLAVFFETTEKLLASDRDAVTDVYGAYDAF